MEFREIREKTKLLKLINLPITVPQRLKKNALFSSCFTFFCYLCTDIVVARSTTHSV